MRKVVVAISVFMSVLLLFCTLAPYIPLRFAPFLPLLSISAPLIFIGNLFCLLVCVLLRLRAGWLTAVSVLIFHLVLGSFYKLGSPTDDNPEGLKVMSYNTRGFDRYQFFRGRDIVSGIHKLVTEAAPDVVCFQEFDYQELQNFKQYPHHFFNYRFNEETHVSQAIFSKYPIVGKGSLEFPDTKNNAIFADILYEGDTVRIYNMHLQSYQIIPSRRLIRRMASGRFYQRVTRAFIKQEQQAELVREHIAATEHKSILCGDFNNTQFSRPFRLVKGEMLDSYEEAGHGYGTTYKLKFLPLRIDAIFADPGFEVVSHRNFDIRLSDHYPVMAVFKDSGNP